MPRPKVILTAKELAVYLGIHPLTLERYARLGKVPGFKIGASWRFDKRQIARWLKGKKEVKCPLILREN